MTWSNKVPRQVRRSFVLFPVFKCLYSDSAVRRLRKRPKGTKSEFVPVQSGVVRFSPFPCEERLVAGRGSVPRPWRDVIGWAPFKERSAQLVVSSDTAGGSRVSAISPSSSRSSVKAGRLYDSNWKTGREVDLKELLFHRQVSC